MRCPNCNKFASYDELDPEIEVGIGEDGTITGSVSIVNASECCGDDLTGTTFEVELAEPLVGVEQHVGEGHELDVEETSSERTSRKEGAGRYAKTFYGARADFSVTCKCKAFEVCVSWENDIQASAMDDLT